MKNFFVNRPIFAIALAVAIVLGGLVSMMRLAVEEYPDITPPVVEVSASYPGADAQTVDEAVATPVSQSVMGVSDMLYMKAVSANDGSMTLQVTFEIGSDPDMDAIFTQNRVSAATPQLPGAVTQQGVTTQKSMTGFLMVYSLHSDGRYDDDFLSNYAYINLRNPLLAIDGVGKVSIMGAGEYAMRVWVRPDVLDYYGISLEEITSAIQTQGGLYPVGKFGAEPSPAGTSFTYTVTLPPQFSTAEQFADIVLRLDSDGNRIRLRDVAEVALGSQSYGMRSLYDGHPSSMLVIYQEPGSNAVEVGEKVRAELARLTGRLPDGMQLSTIVDTTASIRAGIRDIFRTLLIALVLVVLIIYLFLQDWRATLIPMIAIPVSLVGAFALFTLLGFSINVISMLGLVLAIGLVVDDAIVVVEAVQVEMERGRTPREAAAEAMRNVSSPIIATTVVLLAVFLPVSLTGGITGRLFQQFSVTIAVSVVLSAFNALTLSPALCGLLLRPRKTAERGFFGGFNRWFGRLMKRYDARTTRFVRRTGLVVGLLAVVMAAIGVTWHYLPAGFLPEEDQGYLMVSVSTPDATSLPVTLETMRQVDAVVSALPEVASTTLAAGFDMLAGIASTSSGILFVQLVPYGDRKASAAELARRLTEELYMAVPSGESFAFIPPAIPGLGVASGATVEVQDLEGRGSAYLYAQTQRLMEVLRKDAQVATVTTQYQASVPQRRLDVDREHALAEGIPLGTLYGELSAWLGGRYVNNFTRFGRLYQTWMQAAPDYRLDASSIGNYYVENQQGKTLPLSSFVTVTDTVGVEFVEQFNLDRSIELTVTPAAGTSSGELMAAIGQVAAEVLPEDVGIAWSGLSFQQQSASRSGWLAYVLALLFVFLALAALYESWSLPVSILLGVPLAVLGATAALMLAHLVHNQYVNDVYAQISLILLIGLAAKNAILVVEYANRLFFDEGRSLEQAALGAARLRVRPILMTAFAFVLGVAPLVFASGVYATARNVMGTALVGGMLLATLGGIFFYPALYALIGRWGGLERIRAGLDKPKQAQVHE